jgi:LPS-assembly protein
MKFSWSSWAAVIVATTLARAESTDSAGDPISADTGAAADEIVISSKDGQEELGFDEKTAAITSHSGVVARWKGATLVAHRLSYSEVDDVYVAEGEVTITRVDGRGRTEIWRGERVRYNFRSGSIDTDSFRLGNAPLFASGASLSGGKTNDVQTAVAATITTDDVSDPGYQIKARSMTVGKDHTIRAKDAVLYMGGVPVMYFPSYSRNLDRHPNFWTLTPGYRSLFGPFLLGKYHYFPSTNVETTLSLDWRQKRGFAGGPGINYDIGELGQGSAGFYYAHDDEPGLDAQLRPISSNRYRTFFNHRLTVGDGFEAKAVVRQQSDPYVVRDFYEYEYRRDPQPKTLVEATQFWRNFSLDVLAQPQVNGFFRTVERLPDVKLTGLRQELGQSGLYYDTESSLAYLRYHEGVLPGMSGTNYAALRADTYHQITLPQTVFGWLNLTPRVGGRFTHYGETEESQPVLGEQNRSIFNTGAEVSFRASRVWPSVRSEWLEMDGVRHIVEPSVNYVYVPRPDARPLQLPQFDTLLPSYRLLPLEFPDYNSIDSVDSENTFRLGLRNKLQTKRNDQVENVVNWAAYTDWRMRPRPGQSTFPDLYNDLEFSPRSWIVLSSTTRYNINGGFWDEAYHRLTLQPGDDWSWTVGHRYLVDDPATYGVGNNLFISSFRFKVNEDWAVRASHQFEARDGVLEEHAYTLYRDLRSWTAALTLRLRDNRTAKSDWAIVLTFQLKAFPRFKLNSDRDRAEWLSGG